MSDDKSITRVGGAIEVRNMDDVERLARVAVASGLVRVKRAEEAAVILLTGRELGLSPMQSLRGIYVVNGSPVLSADLLVAVVRASGLCASWRTVESTADLCTIETLRRGEDKPARRTWTMADAKRAGITGKQTWAQYPTAMLRHRCAADLAREVYPDVCLGLYTPEELEGVEVRPVAETVRVVQPQELDAGAEEVSDAQLPPALEAFYARVNEIELPGEGISVWMKHRNDLAPLAPETRETAWKALVAKVEKVGKMQNAKVWLKKAIAEEDARRGQSEEPPPDGTSGPRRGPGPVSSAEGSASASGGTSGAPEASNVVSMDARTYLASKVTRSDLRNAVKRFGKTFGEPWMRLAAQRLVAIDAPANGGLRLTEDGAMNEVRRWRDEPPKSAAPRKAVAR